MKMKLLAAIMAACLLSASAQASNAPYAEPSIDAQKLRVLIGTWKGTGEVSPKGRETYTVDVTMMCLEIAGGWGIRCEDHMTGKDMNYIETDILGHNTETGHVSWFAITSAGEMQAHTADWTDKTHLMARYEGKFGGKPEVEEITFDFSTPDVMAVKSSMSIDGQDIESMTSKLTKEKPPEPKKK